MEIKSYQRNLAAMIPAYVDRVADFKNCCLRTKRYDGTRRDVYYRE